MRFHGWMAMWLLCGCMAPSPAVDDARSPGGIISGSYDLPESLGALAESIRSTGGRVIVAETVSVSATYYTEPTPAGAVADLYQRYPVATYTVRVVDALGEDVVVGSELELPVILGPMELVYPDGTPRSDWTTSGGPPIDMRRPPVEGEWVLFGYDATDFSGVMQVATISSGVASGEHTDSGADLPVEDLRLSA